MMTSAGRRSIWRSRSIASMTRGLVRFLVGVLLLVGLTSACRPTETPVVPLWIEVSPDRRTLTVVTNFPASVQCGSRKVAITAESRPEVIARRHAFCPRVAQRRRVRLALRVQLGGWGVRQPARPHGASPPPGRVRSYERGGPGCDQALGRDDAWSVRDQKSATNWLKAVGLSWNGWCASRSRTTNSAPGIWSATICP
jgi:hypothetical protein